MKKNYKSSKDFKQAIKEKFKKVSKDTGLDSHDLNRQLSYERFLARLFYNDEIPWVLKGAHALEIRLFESRATKDIDLALKEIKDPKNINEEIHGLLQERAQINLDDFFEFRISESIMELDGPPVGGARFLVTSLIDNKVFHKFLVDIGVGDSWIDPYDKIKMESLLDFAGFGPILVPMVNIEQHFAEKIHAYTLPRVGRFNSRVKDLVDMILLVKEMKRPTPALCRAIESTFKKRGTHKFSLGISPPPKEWSGPFQEYMNELGMELSLENGFKIIQDFLNELKDS